jgi:hypothetical protein
MTRGIDAPDVVWPELKAIIQRAMNTRPRNLQTDVGPSSLGRDCLARLTCELVGSRLVDQASGWRAEVGTFIHAGLAGFLTACDENKACLQPRFLVEKKVMVGKIAGVECWGSADLFDIDSGTIVDYKTTGQWRLKHYRANGPGNQYRTQAHLYGHGFALLGYRVATVMDIFLPRDGELGEAYAWAESYDEQVALDALGRATGLVELVRAIGLEAVLKMLPPCTDQWCNVCPTRKPFGAPPKTIPPIIPTVAGLFGAGKEIA